MKRKPDSAPKGPDAPLCPDCLTPLLLSEEQAPCIYSLLDPDHGETQWWDCANCKAVWETPETDPEQPDWLCQSWVLINA